MKRIAKIKVVSFDELSEEAKARAISDYRVAGNDYPWGDEFNDTLKAIEDIFNVSCYKWEYSPDSHSFSLRYNSSMDDARELKGNRARSWFANNVCSSIFKAKTFWHKNGDAKRRSRIFVTPDYALTGVWLDADATAPLSHFMRGTAEYQTRIARVDNSTSVEDIIYACFDSLFEAVQRDWESINSDEHIAETLADNDYEFTEDGKMWAGYREDESAA